MTTKTSISQADAEDLQRETLEVVSDESVVALLAAKHRVGSDGRGLTVRGTPALLARHRAALRAALPRVSLSPRPPQNPPDDIFAAGTPLSTTRPMLAPADFRTLPRWGRAPKQPTSSDWQSGSISLGSGVSFEEAGVKGTFCLCAACASDDTRCIYASYESVFYGGECETTTYTRVEYECIECGNFTHWEHHHTR